MLGVWQLFLILMIIFALFGAGKLPNVMGDIGKGIRNLKKNLQEDSDDVIDVKEKIKIKKEKQ